MKSGLPFRSWFYFRMGWSTYFVFALGAINTLTACLEIKESIKKENASGKDRIYMTTAISCVIEQAGIRLTSMPCLPLKYLCYGA